MSLDAFAVFVAFLALIEVVLGALVVVNGVRDLRATDPAEREARRPLLALVVGTVIAVALASCPLFYLLLASWVPRWPGLMCVEGVRRIGMGSLGAPGWLPEIVATLDLTKPVLVLVAGAWLVLRRAAGPGAVRAAAFVAMAVGGLALFDGAAQAAYVVIPKEEIPPMAGCCMSSGLAAGREDGLTAAGGAATASPLVPSAFIVSAVAMGLAAAAMRRSNAGGRAGAAVLALFAAATVPLATSFLADVVAPAALRLPYHHCVWCGFAAAPETIAGAALYLAGVLCCGWAFVARLVPPSGEGAAGGPDRALLTTASFGFLGAAAMSAVVMWQT